MKYRSCESMEFGINEAFLVGHSWIEGNHNSRLRQWHFCQKEREAEKSASL